MSEATLSLSGETARTWLVGAVIDGVDRSDEFIEAGIWHLTQNASTATLEKLKPLRVGDRIAIKSAFTKRRDLPFDGGGLTWSVMRIKARGTVQAVEPELVRVGWERLDPPRDWYFYTNLQSVWRLERNPFAQQLQAFIFDDEPQNYDAFLRDDFWAKRLREGHPRSEPGGDESGRYTWPAFFVAIADALAAMRDKRGELATIFVQVRKKAGLQAYLDKFPDGTEGPVEDMDPFTFMNVFNLGRMRDDTRIEVAVDCAERLGVDASAPMDFTGIPVTFPMKAWFFRYAINRAPDDIDRLWDVYEAGLAYADSPTEGDTRARFELALSQGLEVSDWTLATGLYRARPFFFCPMDSNTRRAIRSKFGLAAPEPHSNGAATWYLGLLDTLHNRLNQPDGEWGSVPEFSDAAWRTPVSPSDSTGPLGRSETPLDDREPSGRGPNEDDFSVEETAPQPYTVDDLIADGCFIPRATIEHILGQLREEKNLILEGPPGTGKTWVAKRLGWVLAGHSGPERVRVVQFHPNTSYEDFVRGYRPRTSDGGAAGLVLTDGPFLRLAEAARGRLDEAYTMVIEEINRGNPARALGEMLTLIEASKRDSDEAISLTYPRESESDGVWLPPNLHIIGTMNIADRSLALVDLALRRRFVFITLTPRFEAEWREWARARIKDPNVDVDAFLTTVSDGMRQLNEVISTDPSLGPNFVIGHSFVTPAGEIQDAWAWFRSRVTDSIAPQLREYWFEDSSRADGATDNLLGRIP